ncbi:carbohydrate-binding domain-containing protein [Anaeromicropila populeti]|uniref:Carbohydrate-binding domain-containing protein n=1 Tax=Anaeromicropila populeti TaxID=37658 RepID=A0A1I6KBT6_9FIRM|nr:carbohydrate-binding domain-containing protein [Anaeromicropila populeti]SFR88656.1 protein of unknown function [Anaeromicropila populeti]
MKSKKIIAIFLTILIIATASGCSSTQSSSTASTTENAVEGSALVTTELFSDRDYEQTADTSKAQYITVVGGEDITINEEGVYVISGDAEEVTIVVEAEETAKVQIVLDGVSITNTDAPAIYVKTGDKVFVTTTDSENDFEVTGTYSADGETNLDAVIFSKSDLVLNGIGTLNISSATGNGITSKDDLKITGGSYTITASKDGLEANDFVGITDGTIHINAGADAIHSENDEDDSQGSIYISGGTLEITAGDDGIRGTSVVQVDGGNINITSSVEGIEGTYIQINDGTITVYATDDGINATSKSTSYDVIIEVNGGNLTVEVGSGDTDAFDANGTIIINDGIVNVTANSGFDWDVAGELNGGTVTLNGEVITELPESMMGGGGKGGMGGNRSRWQ